MCLERETGIEPATNGLGSRYSTIELLPLRPNYTPEAMAFAAVDKVAATISTRP